MKITDVTTYIVGNPWKNWVFTRVDTDAGLHGIGEATLNGFAKTVEAAIHELKRFVIGQDPFDVENHTLRMFRDVFSDGGQVQGAALSGIEFVSKFRRRCSQLEKIPHAAILADLCPVRTSPWSQN